MRPTYLAAILLSWTGLTQPAFSVERLGSLELGIPTHFEYDAASGHLVQVVERGDSRHWKMPDSGILLQIEYSYETPAEPQTETATTRLEHFPVALSSTGAVYRGNPATLGWSLIGYVPPSSAISGELFASHLLTAQLVFAANDSGVWYSRDLGSSWKKLGDLPDEPKRLVVSRDLDVVVFTKAGLAIEGKAEFTKDGDMRWNPAIEALPITADDEVFYGGRGHYSIVPVRGSASVFRSWRFPSGSQADTVITSRKGEAAARNIVSRNCKWVVLSSTPSRGWSKDNYWDFSSSRTEIDLYYDFISGDNRNCIWQAPFRSARFEIRKSDNSEQVFQGKSGRYRFIAYANLSRDGVVRAFSLHIADPGDYAKYGRELTAQDSDLWAVLVQSGAGSNLTACEVFRTALRAGNNRSTLTIPVDGSNSNCPVARSTSIACLSQDGRSIGQASRVAAYGPFLPMASGGAGECLLPDMK